MHDTASGAMDMEGDRARASKSLALVYGKKPALRVSGLLFVAFAAVSFLPFAMGWLGPIYLVIFVPMGLAVLYSAVKLQASRSPDEGRAILRYLYLGMTVFIVLTVAAVLLVG